jgi:hypothetical protein
LSQCRQYHDCDVARACRLALRALAHSARTSREHDAAACQDRRLDSVRKRG